jgi:hypothetical protein
MRGLDSYILATVPRYRARLTHAHCNVGSRHPLSIVLAEPEEHEITDKLLYMITNDNLQRCTVTRCNESVYNNEKVQCTPPSLIVLNYTLPIRQSQ